MKTLHLLLLLMLSLLTTSCLSLALKVLDIDNPDAEVIIMANKDKTVAFVPMKHIGPKEFYEDVKKIVDSLHAENYIVFLESTRIIDSLSKEQKDTISLKMRKMMGVYLSKKGYLDTINGRLMGRKFNNKKMKLVNQPKYSIMGSDSLTDRIVDVPMNRIVSAYETKYGVLELNPCDYTTAPEEKYECDKEPKKQVDEMIMGLRNKNLSDAILAEPRKKIAVLYGARHRTGVLKNLRQSDSTWVIKPKGQ